MPTPRSAPYDHAERVRSLLRKRIDTMPLRALIRLQEVAALLASGERLDTFLARDLSPG
jgi:hypothetical protein